MPLLGPALGPIAGGFISENTTWRWIFYAVSCFDGLVLILGVFLLQETYAPVLLQRKRNKLIKQTNNKALHTKYDDDHRLVAKLGTGFTRPFILLFTQPIVQALAIYMAITYGLTYLVLSTFSSLFTSVYHESVGISGLNYISIAAGCYIGAQTAGLATDRIYRKLTARDPEGKGRPEFRIPFILVGAALVPAGLLWYGWSAEAQNHWIVPNLGIAVFSAGLIVVMISMQAYILDTYARYAASALAAVGFLRALAGFGFPLFAPAMYVPSFLG
jgi:MFS family permease